MIVNFAFSRAVIRGFKAAIIALLKADLIFGHIRSDNTMTPASEFA